MIMFRALFVLLCSFPGLTKLITAGVLCLVAALTCGPVLHHCVFIFFSWLMECMFAHALGGGGGQWCGFHCH